MTAELNEQVKAFLTTWQPRQRRAAGLQAALFTRIDALRRSHPDWQHYDLITALTGALHLIIENDRLTGGRPRSALIDDVTALCAWQQPGDDPHRHRDIAEAIMDVLVNERDRQTRMTDRYVRADADGNAEYPIQSFSFVTTTGTDESREPVLRATPEAVNVFQNLVEFDPFDRLAAERYRSERMLERRDYDDVLDSVERRATSVHGLSTQLEVLLRRISYNIRDVDYAADVMPHLDEILLLVAEQVDAEERFAASVAEHLHLHAPDLSRLQRLDEALDGLLLALMRLQLTGTAVQDAYEVEQDRQLFTHRQLTINPQAQLFGPLLDLTPGAVADILEPLLATLLGPRTPKVLHLQRLADIMTPTPTRGCDGADGDPFDLGGLRPQQDDFDPAVLAAVHEVLGGVTTAVKLSRLLETLGERTALDDMAPASRRMLPYALAVTVAGAYGTAHDPHDTGGHDTRAALAGGHLAVVRTGETFAAGPVAGDDLVLVPQPGPGPS